MSDGHNCADFLITFRLFYGWSLRPDRTTVMLLNHLTLINLINIFALIFSSNPFTLVLCLRIVYHVIQCHAVVKCALSREGHL